MKVKGTALKTTRDFVKAKFPDKFEFWYDQLPEGTKRFYSGHINVSNWYPFKEAYLIPMEYISKIFYNENEKTAGHELGEYSADIALKGVYKVFLFITSPNYLMTRASKIITTYYNPSEVKIADSNPKSVTLHILKFPEISQVMEYRLAGWCKRALELAHCKGVSYNIEMSLTKADALSCIVFSWL